MARSSGPDGQYNYRPWDKRPPFVPDQVAKRWQYSGPWSSNEERLTSQALMVMNVPGADIQAMVRPNLPQIRLFPEKYGYNRKALGIDDIVTIDRNYIEPRVGWYSGGVAGYTGSMRNSLGNN